MDELITTNSPLTAIPFLNSRQSILLAKELNINTIGELIYYFPYKYYDRREFIKIANIASDSIYIQLKGKIVKKEIIQTKGQRLVVKLADDSGQIDLIFFGGIQYIHNNLKTGVEYVVFGKPKCFCNLFSMVHPEIITLDEYTRQNTEGSFMPIYHTTERMKKAYANSKNIERCIRFALKVIKSNIPESLDYDIISRFNLLGLSEALINIHFPRTVELLDRAKNRLKFEELLYLQLDHMLKKVYRHDKYKGIIINKCGKYFNEFYAKNLPFELTNSQKRVIKEIYADLRSGHQMNRLLQGDVGSGKTLVALLSMILAKDSGFQSSLIAPTEILANQHYNSIKHFLGKMNIQVALLTGSIKGKARKNILSNLIEGAIDILIGTHAIFETNVKFKDLGLVVIDEQHRFGVEQRSTMWNKNNNIPPHILVMTATPIPRTLAMTVYGDLDCSVINELPKGRKPIRTVHMYDSQILKVYAFIRDQIKEGRQIYIVYPLIKESEKMDLKDLMEGFEQISNYFPLPEYQVSIVHGQMPAQDKEYEMDRFARGITNIMVATTVIEVGVDVKNATVMIIFNAERFGLSQLHQLRGRVGRGDYQSYCILMSKDDISKESKQRIDIMCQTNDGFLLAKADLALRGPGQISGTKQSGVLDLNIADIVKDEPIVEITKQEAENIIRQDPYLKNSNHSLIREYFIKHRPSADYSIIS